MKLKSLISFFNKIAPPHFAYPNDPIGLQVGDKTKDIKKVVFALDITSNTVNTAIKNDVDLIVAHHPLIYNPLKKIDGQEPQGKMLFDLIKNDIAVFIMHTNLDVAEGGVNDILAQQYGLDPSECKPLEVTYKDMLYKVAIFVPKDYVVKLRDAICKIGAGHIGNYSHCTFALDGQGTFLGMEGTDPFIGQTGKMEVVDEIKLETIVPSSLLDKVVQAIKKVHPYEEVAYDIYDLYHNSKSYGIGRIGKDKKGKMIAVCSGSGGKFVTKVSSLGAQKYIVGEIGYHDVLLADELGLNLEILGHYESEIGIVEVLASKMREKYADLIEVI